MTKIDSKDLSEKSRSYPSTSSKPSQAAVAPDEGEPAASAGGAGRTALIEKTTVRGEPVEPFERKNNNLVISFKLKKYLAIVKINFANRMAYPVDIISEIIFLTFIFSILFFLHKATAGIAPTSPIEKISLAQTMWIIFFTTIFAGERGKGVSHALNDEILSGQIAYQLNRPYSYAIFHFAQHIGTKLPAIILGGLITSFYVYFLVGLPTMSLGSLFLGLTMICIGIVINFLIQFCIGLTAFWIGNVDPLRWIYLQVMIVAGGMSVPLALFPAAIKKIILLLPFSNVIYGAARIIVGCQNADLLFYVFMQLFWLGMMLLITRFIFKLGVKNVVICGG
jgi:ABC-2 type transport system permease protein